MILRRTVFFVVVAGILALATGTAWAQSSALEYAVKATYLYKFLPFVDWPAAVFATPDSPFVLCIGGGDPLGDVLDRAVDGQRIGNRPITVRRLRIVSPATGCHLLYETGSDAQSVEQALNAVRNTPVLTVTDGSRDSSTKGIIHFIVQDNRVRFEIDNAAAARNGLAISSKLLSLAVAVRARP